MTISLLLFLLFSLFASTYLIRPIMDPDIFWHLKSGEWLWLKKSWPIPDPFSFTSPEKFNSRQIFIIKGYWLAQVIFYFAHSILGWAGLIVLRFGLFVALLITVWAQRSGSSLIWAGLVFIYLVSILAFFPIERPQFFTFIFFAWFYLFVHKYFLGDQIIRKRHVAIACTLMLLWGNLHGGVILGQLVLFLGAMCAAVRAFCRPFQSHFAEHRNLLIFLGICVVSSFCNPNAVKLPAMVFQIASATDPMFAVNDEFASLIQLFQSNKIPILIPYMVFLALGLWGLIAGWRTQPLFGVLFMAGTAIYAGMNVRYHPLFMLTVLPVAATGIGLSSMRRLAVGLIVAVSLFFGLFFTRAEMNNLAQVSEAGWVSNDIFPVAVADNFLERPAEGHLFNLYRWGGYLLWRIGPEHKVFVDGRSFDDEVIRDALTAELVSFKESDMPLWKKVFDKYHIDSAILPINEGGVPYALTMALFRDPDWILAYQSGNAALFLKHE